MTIVFFDFDICWDNNAIILFSIERKYRIGAFFRANALINKFRFVRHEPGQK